VHAERPLTVLIPGSPSLLTSADACSQYIRMQMAPASGTSMPPNITQVTKLANSMHGEKALQMKLKVRRPAAVCRPLPSLCLRRLSVCGLAALPDCAE
jgi:hypothetical protein